MCFIALITSIVFGSITLVSPKSKDVGISLTFGFLSVAFGSKAIQKIAENKT
jgi:hypothetical protein